MRPQQTPGNKYGAQRLLVPPGVTLPTPYGYDCCYFSNDTRASDNELVFVLGLSHVKGVERPLFFHWTSSTFSALRLAKDGMRYLG